MLHRIPGPLAVLLLALPLLAAPHLASVTPTSGFPYGGTHVTLEGQDLVASFVSCSDECQRPPSGCPVTVLFGATPAEVLYALPDRIFVVAPPHAEGKVDVTVRVAGRPDAARQNFFTYDVHAIGSGADYARYLIPIVANETPGAHGSTWMTETTILNASDQTAQLYGPFCLTDVPDACDPAEYAPGAYSELNVQRSSDGDGAFVYVPLPLDHDVALESRVRDTSRSDQNWGTELPIVRTTEFTSALELLDVPTLDRYRATLRVYGERETGVLVRVYQQFTDPGDEPIAELRSELKAGTQPAGLNPLYLQLDPLTPEVRAAAHGAPVRIAVFVDDDSIIDPQPSIWAFLSITNNETQQVTTVTPRR